MLLAEAGPERPRLIGNSSRWNRSEVTADRGGVAAVIMLLNDDFLELTLLSVEARPERKLITNIYCHRDDCDFAASGHWAAFRVAWIGLQTHRPGRVLLSVRRCGTGGAGGRA